MEYAHVYMDKLEMWNGLNTHLAVTVVFFLNLDGTFIDVLVQANAGRDAGVGADDVRSGDGAAAQQIGRNACFQR